MKFRVALISCAFIVGCKSAPGAKADTPSRTPAERVALAHAAADAQQYDQADEALIGVLGDGQAEASVRTEAALLHLDVLRHQRRWDDLANAAELYEGFSPDLGYRDELAFWRARADARDCEERALDLRWRDAGECYQNASPRAETQGARLLHLAADSFATANDNNSELEALLQIARLYPAYRRLDDALFRIGELYYRQTDHSKARRYYQAIVSNYPNSPHVDAARARIEALEPR